MPEAVSKKSTENLEGQSGQYVCSIGVGGYIYLGTYTYSAYVLSVSDTGEALGICTYFPWHECLYLRLKEKKNRNKAHEYLYL